MQVRAVINKSKQDMSGLCPIKLRLSDNGIRKEIYLPGVKVDPKYWDSKKQLVKNDKMLTVRIQNEINKYKVQINKQEALGTPLAPEEMHDRLQNKSNMVTGHDLNVVEYCRRYFVNDLNLTYGTRKGYSSFARILSKYDKSITLDKMDLQWVTGFKAYLIKVHKINAYTMTSRLKSVRRLAKHAYENKVIDKYPLEGLKITGAKANRSFLSIDQLRQLRQLVPAKNLENTFKAYLFACFTGIRFSDLATIAYKNVISTEFTGEVQYFLNFTMRKTQKQINLLLNKTALSLLDLNKIESDELIFDFIKQTDMNLSTDKIAMKIESSNALANKRLKEIIQAAGLPVSLSFHTARNTYATIAIQLGVDLMSLRDLLGHSDLKVTQIYLKVLDSKKDEAMSKFDII